MNTNGLISFDAPFPQSFPPRFPTNSTPPLIAPFWADAQGGSISFRETNDTEVLSRAQNDVQTHFNLSTHDFFPTYAVIVTWFEVVQFGGSSRVRLQSVIFQVFLFLFHCRLFFCLILYASLLTWVLIANKGQNEADLWIFNPFPRCIG